MYTDLCHECNDQGPCSAEETEVAKLTADARRVWGKTDQGSRETGFFVGAMLGMLRGAAMCTKLIVLVPIVMSAPPLKSLAMGAAFAVSSSVYPVLGFILGEFALRFLKYKRALFITSCLLLAGYGVFYMTKAFNHL